MALAEPLTPNVLRIAHWNRLRCSELLASSPRIDWPLLMRRTFYVDVLECPTWKGGLRVLGIIDDESMAHQFVNELSLPHAPRQRARHPATLVASADTDP